MPGLALVILILVLVAIILRGFIPGLPSISVLMALAVGSTAAWSLSVFGGLWVVAHMALVRVRIRNGSLIEVEQENIIGIDSQEMMEEEKANDGPGLVGP